MPSSLNSLAEKRSPPVAFHIMAKPCGSQCNLRCDYCYYLHKKELLGPSPSGWRMSNATLEDFIRQFVEAQAGWDVEFAWQGGEPTLLGMDFFRKVLALQAKHQQPGQTILNDLQTNGTLLDDEWCGFLRQHNFLVGLSIDGPKKLHDLHRRDAQGAGTFDRVMEAACRLKKHGVKFNTLTVVNHDNARSPLDVYRFISREVGGRMMQFIPCVEPKSFRSVAPQKWNPAQLPVTGSSAARPGTPDSIVTDWTVDPDDYGNFLCRVFDEWHNRDYGRKFVNLFESAVAQWMGMPAALCALAEVCGAAMAIEHDGSIYSCDHYVYPEYRLGSIGSTPLTTMAFSSKQQAFGSVKKSGNLPRYCRECRYLFACHGECPKNRLVRAQDGEPGLNYLCPGLRKFFTHIDGRICGIVKSIKEDRPYRV